jgi:hypothetical protein
LDAIIVTFSDENFIFRAYRDCIWLIKLAGRASVRAELDTRLNNILEAAYLGKGRLRGLGYKRSLTPLLKQRVSSLLPPPMIWCEGKRRYETSAYFTPSSFSWLKSVFARV